MTINLHSSRLAVEIAKPGTFYNRTRFDWTAFITQVTLDDGGGRKHTFCVPEDYDPARGTGGFGLCNEFGIEAPIGYDDAQAGEPFPKLGVGLLKRPDDKPYNFFQPHEIAQLFPIHVETHPDSATFVVDPVECRGYAARLIKTVRVDLNTLEIAYTLENTGSKVITTHEYCHNFIGIDKQPTGPNYCLKFPLPIQFHDDVPAMRRGVPPEMRQLPVEELDRRIREHLQASRAILNVQGQTLSLHHTPERFFYCRPADFSRTDQPQWEVTHLTSGVGVRETDDFAPSRVAVWGAAHVISAEIFIDISLEPGQKQYWTRRYEFFA